MAAPADVTIGKLDGVFTMDKSTSTDIEPILSLQGMSWVTRKALTYATLTLHVTSVSTDKPTVLDITIDQVATGGLKGTTEKRMTDWQGREHADHIFGTVIGQSRLLRGSKKDDGKVRPNVDVQTKVGDEAADAKIRRFMAGEILADGKECDGFVVDGDGAELGEGEGLFLQNWVVNQDSGYGWTAEQVWGFEIVDGKRYYTRRVAVAKDKKYELARFVYTYVGPKQ